MIRFTKVHSNSFDVSKGLESLNALVYKHQKAFKTITNIES